MSVDEGGLMLCPAQRMLGKKDLSTGIFTYSHCGSFLASSFFSSLFNSFLLVQNPFSGVGMTDYIPSAMVVIFEDINTGLVTRGFKI